MNGSLGWDRISMNMMYLAIQTLIGINALIRCLAPVSVTRLQVSLGVFNMFIKYSFKIYNSCQILGRFYPHKPTVHKIQNNLLTNALWYICYKHARVIFLDASLQPKLTSRDLLDLVASHFKLKEKEYFGLCYQDES